MKEIAIRSEDGPEVEPQANSLAPRVSGYRGAMLPPQRMEDEEESGIDLRQLLALIVRRRWILISVFFAVVAAGTLLTFLQTPIYQASGTLLVNASTGSSASSDLPVLSDLIGATQARTIETQIEILKSEPIQSGAFERLSSQEKKALSAFRDIQINTVRGTDIVQVAVLSHDPQAATALVQAISSEYIEQSREGNRSQVKAATRYVSDQLNDVRGRLNRAQTALKDYKQKNSTVDLPAESAARVASLGSIEAALRDAQTERAANAAQVVNLRSAIAREAPNVVTGSSISRSPVAQALQQQLTKLELDRLAALQEYASGSPEVRTIEGQMADIRKRLASEAKTEVSGSQVNVNPIRQGLVADMAKAQGQIWALEARAKALRAEAESVRAELTRLPEREYRLGKYTGDVASLQQIYQMLNEKYQGLRISEEANISNATVVSPAAKPGGPISPRKGRNILMSIIVGIVLAFALAALVDRLDDLVHSDADAEAATGLPILAHIPFIQDKEKQSLVGNTNEASVLLESYRMLRTNIEFSSIDEPIRTLVVTSSQPNEGKSTTSLDLAVIMALDGKKVIVVDADLRRPSVHRLLQLPNKVGFTNVVAATCSLEEALQESGVPNVQVLTSGPLPPNPPELLNSKAGRALLSRLADMVDVVIIDTPPALVMVDAHIAASIADATLLVVSFKEANKHQIERTSSLLAQTGTRLLGTVLNKLTNEVGGYYGYYGYKKQYYGRYLEAAENESTAIEPAVNKKA